MYIGLFISLAVFASDIYTAVILVGYDKWSSEINPTVPISISRWIFAGCIILSTLIVFIDLVIGIRILRKKNISRTYTNSVARSLYSIKSYNYFCLFAKITKSRSKTEYLSLFVYFALKGWLRLIFADGPRQVINAMTLWSVLKVNTSFIETVKEIAVSSYVQAIVISLMLFSLVIWIFSVLQFLIALLCAIPLYVHVQKTCTGLEEYCYVRINGRIAKLVRKYHERDLIELKEANKRLSKQPTLPVLFLRNQDSSATLVNQPSDDNDLKPMNSQTPLVIPPAGSFHVSTTHPNKASEPSRSPNERTVPNVIRKAVVRFNDSVQYNSEQPTRDQHPASSSASSYAQRSQTPAQRSQTAMSNPFGASSQNSQVSAQRFDTPGPNPFEASSQRSQTPAQRSQTPAQRSQTSVQRAQTPGQRAQTPTSNPFETQSQSQSQPRSLELANDYASGQGIIHSQNPTPPQALSRNLTSTPISGQDRSQTPAQASGKSLKQAKAPGQQQPFEQDLASSTKSRDDNVRDNLSSARGYTGSTSRSATAPPGSSATVPPGRSATVAPTSEQPFRQQTNLPTNRPSTAAGYINPDSRLANTTPYQGRDLSDSSHSMPYSSSSDELNNSRTGLNRQNSNSTLYSTASNTDLATQPEEIIGYNVSAPPMRPMQLEGEGVLRNPNMGLQARSGDNFQVANRAVYERETEIIDLYYPNQNYNNYYNYAPQGTQAASYNIPPHHQTPNMPSPTSIQSPATPVYDSSAFPGAENSLLYPPDDVIFTDEQLPVTNRGPSPPKPPKVRFLDDPVQSKSPTTPSQDSYSPRNGSFPSQSFVPNQLQQHSHEQYLPHAEPYAHALPSSDLAGHDGVSRQAEYNSQSAQADPYSQAYDYNGSTTGPDPSSSSSQNVEENRSQLSRQDFSRRDFHDMNRRAGVPTHQSADQENVMYSSSREDSGNQQGVGSSVSYDDINGNGNGNDQYRDYNAPTSANFGHVDQQQQQQQSQIHVSPSLNQMGQVESSVPASSLPYSSHNLNHNQTYNNHTNSNNNHNINHTINNNHNPFIENNNQAPYTPTDSQFNDTSTYNQTPPLTSQHYQRPSPPQPQPQPQPPVNSQYQQAADSYYSPSSSSSSRSSSNQLPQHLPGIGPGSGAGYNSERADFSRSDSRSGPRDPRNTQQQQQQQRRPYGSDNNDQRQYDYYY